MKLAAWQFGVSGDIRQNLASVRNAAMRAADEKAGLIVFPECALTGYPPRDIPGPSDMDMRAAAEAADALQETADRAGIHILAGMVVQSGSGYCNRACLFSPGKPVQWYDKRALWGWDRENFIPGTEPGVFDICGFRIGVRICFEVRFPEYFRELYQAGTDLNIVLFYDVSDHDDADRYGMIRGHLVTRAVENVTPVLSVNAIRPWQTAPTCMISASGTVCCELERNREGLLVYDFEKREPDFGESGRKQYSDWLLGLKG